MHGSVHSAWVGAWCGDVGGGAVITAVLYYNQNPNPTPPNLGVTAIHYTAALLKMCYQNAGGGGGLVGWLMGRTVIVCHLASATKQVIVLLNYLSP